MEQLLFERTTQKVTALILLTVLPGPVKMFEEELREGFIKPLIKREKVMEARVKLEAGFIAKVSCVTTIYKKLKM